MSSKKRKSKVNKYADKTEPQAILDYHDYGILTESEIIKILNDFILNSQKKFMNKLLIITGKGLHSQDNVPIIKPLVQKQLQSHPDVKSFSPARIDRGGTGAFEVTLSS